MISLKAFLPVLSKHTDLSVTALYERQRALVRLGLLPAPTKSGRNSGGAMARPGSVAVMLIAVMATDNLSEFDDRIMQFLSLQAYPWNPYQAGFKPGHCNFTERRTLFRAVQTALADQDLSAPLGLEVIRKYGTASLIDLSGENVDSRFGKNVMRRRTGIEHVVTFHGLFDLACELDFTPRSDAEKFTLPSTWETA